MSDQFNDEAYPGITALRAAWKAASPRARNLFHEELHHSSLGDVSGGPLFRDGATKRPEAKTTDPFATIQDLLDDTRKALPERADLRRVFTIAGLQLIRTECERLTADLEDRRQEFRFDRSAADTEQPY